MIVGQSWRNGPVGFQVGRIGRVAALSAVPIAAVSGIVPVSGCAVSAVIVGHPRGRPRGGRRFARFAPVRPSFRAVVFMIAGHRWRISTVLTHDNGSKGK